MNKGNHLSPVAIIGMSCHLPGANTIDKFWDLLKSGQNSLSFFSDSQLQAAGVKPDVLQMSNYIKCRGILTDIDHFQPEQFHFSADELGLLNYQTQIFLQITQQALNTAGFARNRVPANCAVYTGTNDGLMGSRSVNGPTQMYNICGIKEFTYAKSLASILAYQFDLHGPAVNLYTGCSTSQVAIIKACQDLQTRQVDMAIAGGIAFDEPQIRGYFYEAGSTLSQDGFCRTFDQRATGAVLSNGAGVVILKRLDDAIHDDDPIIAVISGFAINNDGRRKTGFLAPGIHGQYQCIKQAWQNAKLDIKDLIYVETHGTATLVGDPIEVYALSKAAPHATTTKSCGLGSVKSNIGHTTIASGVASLIKSALMLQYKAIVPTLYFETLNKNINLDNSPFYIANDYHEFSSMNPLAAIGVSNFGFGGTNTHVVLRGLDAYLKGDL